LHLTEGEYYVLSVLGVEDDRSLNELNALVEFGGRGGTEEIVTALSERGLVTIDARSGAERRVALTPVGRQMVFELFAVAKAADADAQADLGDEEAYLLRQLLKRVIRSTDPGVPALWRKRPP
jgi:3-hydroxy-9,10-secoandrosta-1,3,5(10)-triene-9,17-dione monooxygenase reductase component